MKGIICYYSGSGNTLLASQYLSKQIKSVEWTFCNILKEKTPDFSAYHVVGFATFTDFWGVPQRMLQFLQTLPKQENKLAFTLTTFGMIALFSLRDLSRAVRKRGFKIVAGTTFHMPENYPPMICGNMAMEDSPSLKELESFRTFANQLEQGLQAAAAGKAIKAKKPGEGLLSLVPAPKRTTARKDMGEKFVDEKLCTQCKTCEKGCPYQAIVLAPYPVFDMTLCYGCWSCFHHCPKKAIYTKKFRGKGHYPKPIQKVVEKMG